MERIFLPDSMDSILHAADDLTMQSQYPEVSDRIRKK